MHSYTAKENNQFSCWQRHNARSKILFGFLVVHIKLEKNGTTIKQTLGEKNVLDYECLGIRYQNAEYLLLLLLMVECLFIFFVCQNIKRQPSSKTTSSPDISMPPEIKTAWRSWSPGGQIFCRGMWLTFDPFHSITSVK